ncbi:hypothetical protein LTR53_020532, partial [Teratosphaeriaceae sp. CCFEE 6253]
MRDRRLVEVVAAEQKRKVQAQAAAATAAAGDAPQPNGGGGWTGSIPNPFGGEALAQITGANDA